MPRGEREKEDDAIYHVMVRSISEVQLFKYDKDKEEYLAEMRHYKKIYNFKIYAYCIMTNHAHFIIDSNGADISSIMHSLNFKYAVTYNRVHKRHGHLFQDRFKSKIVNTNSYLHVLTAYIHNNPLKIKGYENCPEKYKYSSLKVYLGLEKDDTKLLDKEYMSKILNPNKRKEKENYLKFVYMCDDKRLKAETEFESDKTEYRSEKKILVRDFKTEDILKFISEETGIKKVMLYIKNSRKTKIGRALAALLMRSLCNCKVCDICKVLGNITESRVSKLCSIGVEIISTDEKYCNVMDKFITKFIS